MFQLISIALLFYTGISMFCMVPVLNSFGLSLGTETRTLQLVIATQMLFYGIFKSFWVFFSTRVSDKVILTISMLLSFLGLGYCILMGSVHAMFIGKILEGIGLSGSLIIVRTSIHKKHDSGVYAKFISNASNYIFLSFYFGPLIGIYFIDNYSWRILFVGLIVGSIVLNTLLATTCLKANTEYLAGFNFSSSAKSFFSYFCNREILGYLLPCVLTIAACFSFFIFTPNLYYEYLVADKSIYYGFNALFPGLFVVGDFLYRLLKNKVSAYYINCLAFVFLVLSILGLFLSTGILNSKVFSVALPVSLLMFSTGIICSNSMSHVRSLINENHAEASAIFPFAIFIFSALGCYILSTLSVFSPVAYNNFFAGFSLLAIFTFFLFARKNGQKPQE